MLLDSAPVIELQATSQFLQSQSLAVVQFESHARRVERAGHPGDRGPRGQGKL